MSIAWGTQYAKLKTNLRLAANRLKLLQKKKTELAMKARTEIADFLVAQKEDRARIRVESIIREDFLVEAYELLEMYCELLLARFGIIQQMKNLDDGIAEAVISLLWVAPRIMHEISEFKIISDQLTLKYGKQFAEAARTNQLAEPAKVNPKLIQKLSVNAPSKLLVEKYLIEIARSAGIDFRPDEKIMREDDDEVAKAEQNLINFMKEEQIGWSVSGPNDKNHPPGPNYGSGGGSSIPAPFQYPPPNHEAPRLPQSNMNMYPTPNAQHHIPSFTPPAPPTYNMAQSPHGYAQSPSSHDYPVKIPPNPEPGSASAPTEHDNDHIYEVPPAFEDLPPFPEPPKDLPSNNFHNDFYGGSNTSGNGGGAPQDKPNNDLNFDELARRFDQLKKKL